MKKLLVVMTALFMAGCSYVPAGNVGVKVYLYGSNKGVDAEELGPGKYFIGWNEDLYIFPTFQQNVCWTKVQDRKCGSSGDEQFIFQAEGLKLEADVGLSYVIDPTRVTQIFQTYRKGVEEITDTSMRMIVRNALNAEASTMTAEQVYSSGKNRMLENVLKRVRAEVGPVGINVVSIYIMGDIALPPQVVESINSKIEATQRAQQKQNEVATAKAEADKVIESARGRGESVLIEAQKQAEANKVLNNSITPELIGYKKLENEQKAIAAWNGTLPSYMGGSTPVPFINVGAPTAPIIPRKEE